jgi:murein L,D-transpeptidase YafK
MIMIHGTPDTEDTPEDLFHTLDWTDGCVAMRNRDMREVWNLHGWHDDRDSSVTLPSAQKPAWVDTALTCRIASEYRQQKTR